MDVVTGAFSFTGRYVTARLLELGRDARALTRKAQSESPFGDLVRASSADSLGASFASDLRRPWG